MGKGPAYVDDFEAGADSGTSFIPKIVRFLRCFPWARVGNLKIREIPKGRGIEAHEVFVSGLSEFRRVFISPPMSFPLS